MKENKIAILRPIEKGAEVKRNSLYNGEEVEMLSKQNAICKAEMERIKTSYPEGVSVFPSGEVGAVNLTILRKNGVSIYAVDVNREHGRDEKLTGESICTYGAQHHLIISTVSSVLAAGIKISRFANDPDKDKPISNDGIVILDGHGRMNYLMGLPVNQWLDVYGNFPQKDKTGFYNLSKVFSEININVSKWKSSDMLIKRRIEDGDKAHEGLKMIDEFQKRGYMYQAACQLATLKPDRIKAKDISGDVNEIFKHYKHAKKISDALIKIFGEGNDKTLKTKEFSKEVCTEWDRLRSLDGDDLATKRLVGFLEGLSRDVVEAIKNAKTENGVPKDVQRVTILKSNFDSFYKTLEKK